MTLQIKDHKTLSVTAITLGAVAFGLMAFGVSAATKLESRVSPTTDIQRTSLIEPSSTLSSGPTTVRESEVELDPEKLDSLSDSTTSTSTTTGVPATTIQQQPAQPRTVANTATTAASSRVNAQGWIRITTTTVGDEEESLRTEQSISGFEPADWTQAERDYYDLEFCRKYGCEGITD